MHLLALDIGGTTTRLAHCQVESRQDFTVQATTQRPTPSVKEGGFDAIIEAVQKTDAPGFLPIGDYDALAIAIAGPVCSDEVWPPNLDWSLNLSCYPALPRHFLLNDFAAQAYCLRDRLEADKMLVVREGQSPGGHCAIIGAGTGLGHCLLVPGRDGYDVIPSEAGQSGFVFEQSEQAIAAFFQSHLMQEYATNDQVVSGAGLECLHRCLQGETATAKQICEQPERNQATLDQFARFYARACRQYCLSGCVTDTLVISGGIAAKHPWLVQKPVFLQELNRSATHRHLLERIGLTLNTDEQLGIEGIIRYSLEQLFPL